MLAGIVYPEFVIAQGRPPGVLWPGLCGLDPLYGGQAGQASSSEKQAWNHETCKAGRPNLLPVILYLRAL